VGFLEEYNKVMGIEKRVFSRTPGDSGGDTFCGIARNKNPDWAGWPLVDREVRAMRKPQDDKTLMDMVAAFYLLQFWNPLGCQVITSMGASLVAGELFEASVNCGKGMGSKFLQRALNELNRNGKLYPDLDPDGKVGPKTLDALATLLKRGEEWLVYRCQNGEQYSYYKSIKNHEALPGWFGRT